MPFSFWTKVLIYSTWSQAFPAGRVTSDPEEIQRQSRLLYSRLVEHQEFSAGYGANACDTCHARLNFKPPSLNSDAPPGKATVLFSPYHPLFVRQRFTSPVPHVLLNLRCHALCKGICNWTLRRRQLFATIEEMFSWWFDIGNLQWDTLKYVFIVNEGTYGWRMRLKRRTFIELNFAIDLWQFVGIYNRKLIAFCKMLCDLEAYLCILFLYYTGRKWSLEDNDLRLRE